MYNIAECLNGGVEHPDFWLAVEAQGKLESIELQRFIAYRDIGGKSWEEIAELTGYTPVECLALHGIATRSMQRMMEKLSKEVTR